VVRAAGRLLVSGAPLIVLALCLSPSGTDAAQHKNAAPRPSSQLVGTWTSGDKDGFGTAYTYDSPASPKPSRVWFTLLNGALSEAFYPTLDTTAINRLNFVVADGKKLFADETQGFARTLTFLAPHAPAYRVVSADRVHHVTLTKDVVTDPTRDVILMKVAMTGPTGAHLYAHLEPALQNTSLGGQVQIAGSVVESWKKGAAVSLVTTGKWGSRTVGYRRQGDGLTQLQHKHRLTTHYAYAGTGHVDATVELPSSLTVALGFGSSIAAATSAARASLRAGFASAEQAYVQGWQRYAAGLDALGGHADNQYYLTAESIKAAEDKTTLGAIVASPTHPFGEIQQDTPDNYGYGAVWMRDLYHSAMGLLAAGDSTTPNQVLDFMSRVQLSDGSWPRNDSVAGSPYGGGTQLDEVADPILLTWRLQRNGLYVSMVKRAADYIVANGPSTEVERWEENGGYSPSTIAAEIAGLVAAADMARVQGDTSSQSRYLSTADSWESQIENWTYTTSGPLDNHQYYLRITQGDPNDSLTLSIANGGGDYDQRSIVDGGFLELVRLGIRKPADPHVLASLPVIDAELESTTARGPSWHRYNHDGYGDPPPDGTTNQGHGWPVLSGERGMYDLISGDIAGAQTLLAAMRSYAGNVALLPEQVFEKTGDPTTSARPLIWAQGEYLVLQRSIVDGKPFDMPSIVAQHFGAG
jgi:glucoamylase